MAAQTPPFNIDGMATFVLGRISYGSNRSDTAYTDRVTEECRMALYELEMAGKWDFLLNLTQTFACNAGSETNTGVTDYSRAISTSISWNSGAKTAVIVTPEEAEEVDRRAGYDSFSGTQSVTSVMLQPRNDGKLYAIGYPRNALVDISGGTFSYLQVLTPSDNTTVVVMPPVFFDAWYVLCMARVHENLQTDPVRAKGFRDSYNAKLQNLLSTKQVKEEGEDFRTGITGLEKTTQDVAGVSNSIATQLLAEIDQIVPGKADMLVCYRAAKTAWSLTWNAFNWNFRIKKSSATNASSFTLPTDFDPSYSGTSFYSIDGHHPLVSPEEFAKRAVSPSTASSPAPVTKNASPITISWSGGASATATLLAAPSSGSITYFYRASAPILIPTSAMTAMPDDFYDAWRIRARWLAVEMHGKDVPSSAVQNAKEQWERVYNDLKDSVHVYAPGSDDTDSTYANDSPDGLAEQVYEKINSFGVPARRGACRTAVDRAFRTVWYLKPWPHRKKIKTDFSISVSGTTALPADFAEIMHGSRLGPIGGTEISVVDPETFARERLRVSGSVPLVATIVRKDPPSTTIPAETEWDMLTWPEVAATSWITYLTTPPNTEDAKFVVVPSEFRELWWLLSIYYATEDHPKLDDNTIQSAKKSYESLRDEIVGRVETQHGADSSLTDNTLDDVTAQVRSFVRKNGLDTNHNQLLRDVKRAFNDVWMAHPWRFRVQSDATVDVVAGPHDLPDRFASILPNTPIKTSSGKELPYLPPDQYAARANDSTSITNAVCTILYLEDKVNGSKWQIQATPSTGITGTYAIYYLSTPFPLTSGDLAPLPEEFKQFWILRAEMRALESYPNRTDLIEQRTGRWDKFLTEPEKYDTVGSDSGIADSAGYSLDEITARIMSAIKPFGQPIRSVVRQAAREAIDEIWNMAEWSWRQRTATASLTAGSLSVTLATDFDSLVTDNRPYLTYSTNNNCDVHVLDMPTLQSKRNDNPTNEQGVPTDVAFAWDSSSNAYKAEFEPPADGAYTFNYRYFAKKPAFDEAGTYDAGVPDNMKIPWDTLTWKYALERTTLNRGSLYVLESARDRWAQVRSGLGARNRVAPGKDPIDESGDIGMLMSSAI